MDQTEKIFPRLDQAGYSYVYKTGYKKKHGSLIAYRQDLFTKVDDRAVEYDSQTFQPDSADAAPPGQGTRKGISFFTKNIGNLVALRYNSHERDGVIVATTHLFWHPRWATAQPRLLAFPTRSGS